MRRREFLRSAAALTGASLSPAAKPPRVVLTVRGPVRPEQLGTTLMHEHIMVDFIGADKISRERYDQAEVFNIALPYLKKVAALGCQTLVECTPSYIGRDATLLKKLSEATGLRIITNTGYYGAADDKFVPAHAYRETAEQLAARWIREFNEGIENTGIRPGIIKIGVDSGPLSEIDARLVKAAALTHLQTGLTIGSHTGDGIAAMQQLDLITSVGVSPKAFIWIHAQNEKDPAVHLRAAERGCYVEFDAVNPESVSQHVEMVMNLHRRGWLSQALVSMDAGWYHVGEPGGGYYRGYDSLFTDFLPALQKQLDKKQIRQLLSENPQQALTLQIRRR